MKMNRYLHIDTAEMIISWQAVLALCKNTSIGQCWIGMDG